MREANLRAAATMPPVPPDAGGEMVWRRSRTRGWAKAPDANASGGVPTFSAASGQMCGHGARAPFAHPTKRRWYKCPGCLHRPSQHSPCDIRTLLAHRSSRFTSSSHAEARYPDKAGRIVLPFADGRCREITERIVGGKTRRTSSESVQRESAGSRRHRAARTAHAAPNDAYAGAVLSNGQPRSGSCSKKAAGDPLKDFERFQSGLFDSCLNGRYLDYKTLGDFIAAAKAKRRAEVGDQNVANPNLSAELSRPRLEIDFTIIPFGELRRPQILAGRRYCAWDRQLLRDEWQSADGSCGGRRRIEEVGSQAGLAPCRESGVAGRSGF